MRTARHLAAIAVASFLVGAALAFLALWLAR